MHRDAPHRKRMKRFELPGGVRFITFSCHRRLQLLGSAPIRDIFASSLALTRARFGIELFAWVAMPEHAHLLVRPPASVSLDRALLFLKMSVAQRIINRWREIGAPILARIAGADGTPRYWQKGGGFDRNVRDENEFLKELRYIHWNPVERGLVERPEQWQWSSARYWLGAGDSSVDCDPAPFEVRGPCLPPIR